MTNPNYINDLKSASVVVDERRLKENIRRFQEIADEEGVELWPMSKTHKTAEIADMQLKNGAEGISCATVKELQMLAGRGVQRVILCRPTTDPNAFQIINDTLNMKSAEFDLHMLVDSIRGACILQDLIHKKLRPRVGVYAKIDSGLHRCGVNPHNKEGLETVLEISRMFEKKFSGILTHAGHAYAKKSPPREVAIQERDTMIRFKKICKNNGIPVNSVSVGSTPTIRFFKNDEASTVTNVRPGNYVFMDHQQVDIGSAEPSECALSVVARVISTAARKHKCVLDIGSKVLSSDKGAHGTTGETYGKVLADNGQEFIKGVDLIRLSEEHGVLKVPRDGSFKVKEGDVLRIVPRHACAVVNLADELVIADEQDVVRAKWPVLARGH